MTPQALIANGSPRLRCLFAALALLFVLPVIGSNQLSAQLWEGIYGGSCSVEDGRFRVIPVENGCCTTSCVPSYVVCPADTTICPVDTVVFPSITVFCQSDTLTCGSDTAFCGGDTVICGGDTVYTMVEQTTCTEEYEGYIAVGTSYTPRGDGDVHVVRTNNNGGLIWEYTYDINNDYSDDRGWSIIEIADGSGFVITGETTDCHENTNVFLMKIDCRGNWLWTMEYGSEDAADGGRDLIEATTGTASMGTSAGDIVVAGYTYGVSGSQDAYLLRVTSTGSLIWDNAYDFEGDDEMFWSLTEATPLSTGSTGDIIGAGQTTNGSAGNSTTLALVGRVDGDNGTVGAVVPPQGFARYGLFGSTTPSVFYSVIELQNPAERGPNGIQNVVLSGDYGNTPIDAYVVKLFDGDPCGTSAQLTLRSPNGEDLQGRTIREIQFPSPGFGPAQWDLILTGIVSPSTTTSNLFLISLTPAPSLGPLALQYGGTGREEGWSVYPVDALGSRTYGFIACGLTTTGWTPAPGDPGDMYLLKTDWGGRTSCEMGLEVEEQDVEEAECIEVTYGPLETAFEVRSGLMQRFWDNIVCQGTTSDGRVEAGNSTAGGALPDHQQNPANSGTSRISLYPNPVKVGDPINIVTSDAGPVALGVSTTRGDELISMKPASRNAGGKVTLETRGWVPGVYLITVENEQTRSTIRVVVVE